MSCRRTALRTLRANARACLALLLGGLAPGPGTAQGPAAEQVRFEARTPADLARALGLLDDRGWLAAWHAWLASCRALGAPARPHRELWLEPCEDAAALHPARGAQVREFFAARLDAYRVLAGAGPAQQARETGLLTGYFEPELEGSRVRTASFTAPVYRLPRVVPAVPRARIEASEMLRGEELVWLHDPMEAFFLEVQGSGRVCLSEGGCIRLSYAGNNGQPYRSVGSWLVEQGELRQEKVSMQSILQWARAHPQRVRELLDQDPRVVFFRERPDDAGAPGPAGSLGVPLTAGVSLAVDPRYLPLGAPLLLQFPDEAGQPRRALLAVAQDTGGGIHGPLRLDQFRGSGAAAAQLAGPQRDTVTLNVFVPRGVAPESLLAPR